MISMQRSESADTASMLVDVKNVNKSFGSLHVLKDVNLSIERGTVTCLVGPSGSGKTTLLRCINLLEMYDSGGIFVDGERMGYQLKRNKMIPLPAKGMARQRRQFGMVFQHFNLFNHLKVLDNLTLGPRRVGKTPKSEAEALAEMMLTKVGLKDKIDSYPDQLSGGQKQRVAIARALCLEPKVILFDEPTSALDPELVGEVLSVMKDLASEGMTMVVVTHEMSFAKRVGSNVAFMADGRMVEKGNVDVLSNPESERFRSFLSSINGE